MSGTPSVNAAMGELGYPMYVIVFIAPGRSRCVRCVHDVGAAAAWTTAVGVHPVRAGAHAGTARGGG